MHERVVNCGPQAERGQGPVSLEGKMAKSEAVARHEETQSVVPEAVRDFNLYASCILYIGQTYRYSAENTFYVFSRQIYLIIFFRFSLTIFVYSSKKCRVFPNVTLLGSQNINTVHKWCAKL
jgi:hypothetical protein